MIRDLAAIPSPVSEPAKYVALLYFFLQYREIEYFNCFSAQRYNILNSLLFFYTEIERERIFGSALLYSSLHRDTVTDSVALYPFLQRDGDIEYSVPLYPFLQRDSNTSPLPYWKGLQ